jgi:hypothetical protein
MGEGEPGGGQVAAAAAATTASAQLTSLSHLRDASVRFMDALTLAQSELRGGCTQMIAG